MRSLENAAADYACLLNDVFSYQKEIEYEGEVHNGVLVVQNFFGLRLPDRARPSSHDLMTSRMRQFQHVAAHELPVLYDDFELDAEARGDPGRLRARARALDVGHPDLAPGCRRYREEDLLYEAHEAGAPRLPRQLFGPTGLGTSAARLPVGAVR